MQVNQRRMVPFGYEEQEDEVRGTLLIMDAFYPFSQQDLQDLQRLAKERHFARMILYPFHEQTLKRMGIEGVSPYFSRVKELESIVNEEDIPIQIDLWEGKRKKYTPLHSSLEYLTGKYGSPHFLYISPEIANRFAGFHGFEAWLRKIRLFIPATGSFKPHPLLLKHENRWEAVGP